MACNKSECTSCKKEKCIWKPLTNADRIRSMTDEELARLMTSAQADILKKAGKAIGYPGTLVKDSDIADSEVRWLGWLRQGVKE